jgi:hypothetical protein
MSQSDYIKFIKTAAVLNDLSRNQPVLTQQTYIDGKQFATEVGMSYMKEYINLLHPEGIETVFDMPLHVPSSCPTNFMDCNSGNNPTRTNRVPLDSVYIDPRPVRSYVKHKHVNNTICSCIKNNRFSNSMFLNVKTCTCKGI